MAKKKRKKSKRRKVKKKATTVAKKQGKKVVSSSDNSPQWLPWLLVLLAVGLYLNTLFHQYAFDDSIVITGNAFTKEGFAGIWDLMTRDFFEGIYGKNGMNLTGGRYRPLSLVMFAIEYQFFGLNPLVGHAINILLYGLTALLMFHTLKLWFEKWEGGTVIAFVATLLFAIHPIHTEVVANIKSRDEILALLLVLGAFYALYQILKDQDRTKWMALGTLSFFAAMLSKETAFTYIALIPLALFVIRKLSWSAVIKHSLPFWGVALAYIALRTAMVGLPGGGVENPDIMENPFYGVETAEKLGTIGVVLLRYFTLLLVPYPLTSDYSREHISLVGMGDPMALLGWGLYLAMGIYAAIRIWKRDVVALAILMYLAPLSLVCNLFFNIGAPMGERFLYFSSFGFALAVAFLLVKYGKIKSIKGLTKNTAVLAAIALLVLVFSFLTFNRNPDWYNNATLFAKDVKTSKNSAKMQYYYANSILKKYLAIQQPTPQDKALLEEAKAAFMRSYEIYNRFTHATYNLGLVNVHLRNAQEALKWLNYTLEIEPNHGKAREQLVRVFGELLNQPQKAMEHLQFLLKTVEGQNAANYQHLGILQAMQGNYQAAEKAFLKSISMAPNEAKYYFNLAGMYEQMGQPQKAQQYRQKAAALPK